MVCGNVATSAPRVAWSKRSLERETHVIAIYKNTPSLETMKNSGSISPVTEMGDLPMLDDILVSQDLASVKHLRVGLLLCVWMPTMPRHSGTFM